MQEILQNQPEPDQRKPLPLNILLGALVVIGIALAFWLAFKAPQGSSSRGASSSGSQPMSQAEQMSTGKIQIENMAIHRAENFLHQEVTMLAGELVNTGETTLQELEVTVEFADEMNQIALRESRLALRATSPPLRPGERRPFEVSFEHIPTSWNRQMPSVRVSGLLFEPSK